MLYRDKTTEERLAEAKRIRDQETAMRAAEKEARLKKAREDQQRQDEEEKNEVSKQAGRQAGRQADRVVLYCIVLRYVALFWFNCCRLMDLSLPLFILSTYSF
jgi:Flp pilus assembly protein TadB